MFDHQKLTYKTLEIDTQKQDRSNRNCHFQISMSNSVVYIPFCNSHLHKCFTFSLDNTEKNAQTTLEILTCKSLGADGSTAIARYKTWRRFLFDGAPKISPIHDGCAMDLLIKHTVYLCGGIKNQEKESTHFFK